MNNKILSGIFGLAVADALGVPVEFKSRDYLRRNPVTDMIGYGTYNQPPGTWSDDTSLTLCILDSLQNGLDYTDIMQKFLSWYRDAEYTPHGIVFDVGMTTRDAISRFASGVPALKCGGKYDSDNGNGSLMRILPLAFYLRAKYVENYTENAEVYQIIHNVSSQTHAHPKSLISCGIYLTVADSLFDAKDLNEGIYKGLFKAEDYYKKPPFSRDFKHFYKLYNLDFKTLSEEHIDSGGYVVSTLEAALWCLLNTNSYEKCVLKAVNLGNDTDTVAAVAGGLAGLFYGFEAIPEKWINQIHRLDYIEELCVRFIKNYSWSDNE
ncbi:MAG: ADP-ribosylglycohydrolase family protein [Candidatus Cloacimonetes bacterium]|nr:ADP-ribosylglycohydrolase family protein [Candidatus Cloacimonadota bacterium]